MEGVTEEERYCCLSSSFPNKSTKQRLTRIIQRTGCLYCCCDTNVRDCQNGTGSALRGSADRRTIGSARGKKTNVYEIQQPYVYGKFSWSTSCAVQVTLLKGDGIVAPCPSEHTPKILIGICCFYLFSSHFTIFRQRAKVSAFYVRF